MDQPKNLNYYRDSATLTRGSGEAQVVGGISEIQDVSAGSELFFLATSYAF